MTQLEPQFLARDDDTHFHYVERIEDADGIEFVCPKCLVDVGMVRPGVHEVICWDPNVPQTTSPTPGRWTMEGTGFDDLTLVAGSSSVLLKGGCNAHFFVRNGEIVTC
jgi:hypothetical protein